MCAYKNIQRTCKMVANIAEQLLRVTLKQQRNQINQKNKKYLASVMGDCLSMGCGTPNKLAFKPLFFRLPANKNLSYRKYYHDHLHYSQSWPTYDTFHGKMLYKNVHSCHAFPDLS